MNTAQERIDTAVRNIMSGDNRCGTLAAAATSGNSDYFRQAVKPVIDVYEQEAEQLRIDRATESALTEQYRQALDYIAANALASANAHIQAYAARALGRI